MGYFGRYDKDFDEDQLSKKEIRERETSMLYDKIEKLKKEKLFKKF